MQTAQRFRAWRLWRHLTQKQAAELLGVDFTYVSKLENGARSPSLRLAMAIAEHSGSWPQGPIAAGEWLAAASRAA